MIVHTIGGGLLLFAVTMLHRPIFACFTTSSTSSTSTTLCSFEYIRSNCLLFHSVISACTQCANIVPISATYPQTNTGVSSFSYATDPTTGCRTATMTCSLLNGENQNDQTFIVADTTVFAVNNPSSSITLTCIAGGEWEIDSQPPYVFTTIQCDVGS